MQFSAIQGRLEDARLLTGQGCYVSDFHVPDQAYAFFLRADRAHAQIVSIDTSAACDLPGVLCVLTSTEIAQAGLKSLPVALPAKGIGESELLKPVRPVLAQGKVRFVGEPVVAVVALSREQARDAAEAVVIDYEELPAVVDLAAMRQAMVALGGDPKKINPLVQCDLVVDHSVMVDFFGGADSLQRNIDLEFVRNLERYQLLRWAQQGLSNFRVVPPATGIVHQVNLEYLAKGVLTRDGVAYPDSLVGTDSHTTMINGLGVVGWGVGGIEAEAVMLGQPIYMLMPEVVGFKLIGKLPEGSTATDLVLTVTQMLRKHGVVNKFVEFYGPGLDSMTLPDRATLANMAPEYGATMGFFPVDDETLRFLQRTGRTAAEVELVEKYYKAQGMFRTSDSPEPRFSSKLELDLSTVVASMAGPKRPQDRVLLSNMKAAWTQERSTSFGHPAPATPVAVKGLDAMIGDGAVVIAAITSCTNTSNPSVMLGAGLLARNAVAKGLKSKPWVKTSLAPGSRVVTEYLSKSGLDKPLNQLGFNTVGYGCTTCIGNSGPLPEEVSQAVSEGDLVVSAVLSGNRNFEGRINPQVKANYLASPPLVVAYAIAGTVRIDLTKEPIGQDSNGKDVYLRDIWPTAAEVDEVIRWLTGYDQAALDGVLASNADFRTFFDSAPAMNPARTLITGSVCGVKVQELEPGLMQEIRFLDKLVDELAKGRPMPKVLRAV